MLHSIMQVCSEPLQSCSCSPFFKCVMQIASHGGSVVFLGAFVQTCVELEKIGTAGV